MPTYQLEPELSKGDVVAGDPATRGTDRVLLGKLMESGAQRRLFLDVSGEQVVAILGKRGTGKSYSLGVILEGLASGAGITQISDTRTPRAGLVLDIMDIFWTSAIELSADASPEVSKQFDRMRRGGLESMTLAIDCWVPGGFQKPEIDPPNMHTLHIQAHDLELDDWAALFSVDVFGEPRGMLIADVLSHVSQAGYTRTDGVTVRPNSRYTFSDLVDCIDTDSDLVANYRDDTRRAIKQRMQSYASLQLFQGVGTRLADIVRSNRVSVLMLARVPDELKIVLVAVLLRRILRERRDASFAQKRLDLDNRMQHEERVRLERTVTESIPRSWVLLDEAHVLAGSGASTVASESLVKYAKEGRNYGLSMAVATQQPSALDSRLMSQAETLIVHQLTAPADALVATQNIRSPLPQSMRIDGEVASVESLLRRLGQGEAVFSSGNAPRLPRMCVVTIRPRVSAHGGYEA